MSTIDNTKNIKEKWYLVTIAVTLIGWGVTAGYQKAKIEYLEKDAAHKTELWEKQVEVDKTQSDNIARVTTILEYITD